MNFTSQRAIKDADFSEYSCEEIRAAIKIVCDYSMPGAHTNNMKAGQLAERLRRDRSAPAAIMHVIQAGKSATRVITPFNVQPQLAERYKDYKADMNEIQVQKVHIPIVVGFPNYKGQETVIESLLPGSKVVKFDAPFSMNVAVVAAATRYEVVKGLGRVHPVTPPTALYDQAPYNGVALSQTFQPQVGGDISLQGLDWAHFLYNKFYPDKEAFMSTVVGCMNITTKVCNPSSGLWTKTFSPLLWSALNPTDDKQRVEYLTKMQAYRSKDNSGISAMTYGIYGEEFGPQYRMAEKMGNFKIFLDTLPDEALKCPVRYVSKDEHELISAQNLMSVRGFKLKHFCDHLLDGTPPHRTGVHSYIGDIVYDPDCVTSPFAGKYTDEIVSAYVADNQYKYAEALTKYNNATVIGLRGHVLGLEDHVIGMATPHNAVGVLVLDAGKAGALAIWRTVMIAGHVRNTYLYHRKDLSYFLATIDVQNMEAKRTGKKARVYMPWRRLERPVWFAFTKEQRKRYLSAINEIESFGSVGENISDIELMDMVSQANEDPKFAKTMGQYMNDDLAKRDQFSVVKAGNVLAPVPKKKEDVVVEGEDLEVEEKEVKRPKINLSAFVPKPPFPDGPGFSDPQKSRDVVGNIGKAQEDADLEKAKAMSLLTGDGIDTSAIGET